MKSPRKICEAILIRKFSFPDKTKLLQNQILLDLLQDVEMHIFL